MFYEYTKKLSKKKIFYPKNLAKSFVAPGGCSTKYIRIISASATSGERPSTSFTRAFGTTAKRPSPETSTARTCSNSSMNRERSGGASTAT